MIQMSLLSNRIIRCLAMFSISMATAYHMPAFADASASAEINNLRFELIDPDDGDGITPTISFGAVETTGYTGGGALGYFVGGSFDLSLGGGASASYFGATTQVAAGAATSGMPNLYSSLSASGNLPSGTPNSFSSIVYFSVPFELSANSIVAFDGEYLLSLTTSFPSEGASGQIGLSLVGDSLDNPGSNYGEGFDVVALPGNGSLHISFGNYSTDRWAGTVYFSTLAFAEVTAVPEPETYAMLLAGLGALGFMGRRRKVN